MDFSQYQPRLSQIEKNNRRWGYAITAILLVPFLLLALIWTVHRTHFDNIGEEGKDLIGYMDMGDASEMGRPDFGDGSEGNRDVNNFDESVANPTPPAPNAAQPATPPPVATPTAPEKGESKTLTSKDDSPVSVPDKTKDDKKPISPQPNKPQTPVTPTKPVDTKAQPANNTSSTTTTTKPSTTPTAPSGGANSGKGGDVGNAGSPDIKHLDPEGMYDFGAGAGGGGGGLKGRKALALPKPKYDAQQEGRIKYEFVVDPNGDVVFAKVVPPITKPSIEKAGLEAIKKWKFSKSTSDENQTIRVSITFKLKD